MTAAGYKLKGKHGNVLITVKDSDKQEIIPIAEKFAKLGYTLYATAGTALTLNSNMVAANTVRKLQEQEPNIDTLLESGKIDYVISTATTGREPQLDDVRIRRKTVERSIPCLTSLDTAAALVSCLEMHESMADVELVDIANLLNGSLS